MDEMKQQTRSLSLILSLCPYLSPSLSPSLLSLSLNLDYWVATTFSVAQHSLQVGHYLQHSRLDRCNMLYLEFPWKTSQKPPIMQSAAVGDRQHKQIWLSWKPKAWNQNIYQSSNVSSKALKLKINKIIKNSSIPIVQFADKKLRDHSLCFLPKMKSRILRLGWKLYACFQSDGHELFCECV